MTTNKNARAAWGLVGFGILAAYFFASWEVRFLFFSNQNTYFLQGLRLGGVEGLQDDWLSQTRSPHIAFTLLVAALQSIDLLQLGVRLIEVGLYLALLWSVWTLATARETTDDWSRFLVAGVVLCLVTEAGPWNRVFSLGGLAGQFTFGGYLQPSEFCIAALVAIALLARGRHRLSVGFLVLATTFHVSYLLPCLAVVVAIVVDRLVEGQRRQEWIGVALFGLGVSPAVMYALSFGADPQLTAEAQRFLAREVIPQHAWPATWFSLMSAVQIGVMAAGCVAAWWSFGRAVALAMTALLALTVFGTTFVYATSSHSVALMFPWRASVILYPIALVVLLASVLRGVTHVLARFAPGQWSVQTPRYLAIGLAVVMIAETGREVTLPPAKVVMPSLEAMASGVSPRDEIIVPVEDVDVFNRFRLLVMRPVSADSKSHPYDPAELLQWKRRTEAVRDPYRQPQEERARRCREVGAAFYLDSQPSGNSAEVATDSLLLHACS